MEAFSGIALQDGCQVTLLWTTLICVVLSGLAVLGHLVSRRLKKNHYGMDDWMIVAGLVAA